MAVGKAQRKFSKATGALAAAAPPSGDKQMQPGRGRTTPAAQAPRGENQLDKMSWWDKVVHGQSQSGQDAWAAVQATAAADKKRFEQNNADRIAAEKAAKDKEERERGDEVSTLPGDIATADDALAAYERENNLKPGTVSTGGQTTDQYSANRALQVVEKQTGKPFGTLSTTGGTTLPESPAQERDRWGSGLGAATGVRELTWDEYDALSANQRAAVDANSLLVNAIKSDLSTGARAEDNQDAGYQETLNALFGDTGGSDTYAPNTVSVLSQLGLSDTENGDLDNYLNQAALVNEDDLAAIGSGTFSENARGQQAQLFSERALTSISDTLASGYGVLSGVSAANAESGELNDLFEMLSTRSNFEQLQDNDVSEIMGMFLAENPTVDEGMLTRYFEDRLNAYDYGTAAGQTPSLGAGDAASYISPAEFRGRYYTTGGN